MTEKERLRLRFKELAREFFSKHDAAALAAIHTSIAGQLSQHLRQQETEFKRIAIYEPMRYELPLRTIVAQIPEIARAILLVPKWDETKMWFDAEPDLVIVPGLFADLAGHRLGRGKGYYDRYLAQSGAYHVFLGYAFQLVDSLPTEGHDQRVNAVITA